MKRTEGALRHKAGILGIGLRHDLKTRTSRIVGTGSRLCDKSDNWELVARTADGAAQTDKALALSPEDVLRLLHIFDAGKPVAIMSKIRKQGGAAVLTIPPALLKLMELDVGAQVTLSVERGKLVAEPAMSKRKRYSLSELLKGSAGMKKLTAEAAWAQDGEPVGREIG